MHKIKQFFFTLIFTIIPVITFAQNHTNSPYTRYGYGKLADKSFTAQRGMGGIGYGLRNSKIINSMNPASYSNVDSMTFMLDLGVMGQFAWYEDKNNKESKGNGGLEYLAMQFPLAKSLGVGVGLEPISHVGYLYGDFQKLAEEEDVFSNSIYRGTGGLSQVYGSISYNILGRFSIGTKIAYLFGDIHHDRTSSFSSPNTYSTSWRDTLRINGFTYNLGIQYHQPIGKDKNLVFGVVYTPKIEVNGLVKADVRRGNPSGGTISSDYQVYRDSVYEMPESYGAGITFSKVNKYTLGADVLYQKWSEARFHDKENELYDLLKFNVGGEYIPNAFGGNYFKHIRYRAGAYYSDSYIKVKDAGYKEYGLSVGLGLPTVDRRSIINVAFEYSMLRPEANWMIDENFIKLTLSYTFNELWFFKRKVQ